LSRLRCHGHSLLFSSYCKDKMKEFFLQRLQTPFAESNSPLSGLSCIWASPACHLWHYFFHFWPLVQTLGHGPSFGSPWSSSKPPSLGRGWVAPPPMFNH